MRQALTSLDEWRHRLWLIELGKHAERLVATKTIDLLLCCAQSPVNLFSGKLSSATKNQKGAKTAGLLDQTLAGCALVHGRPDAGADHSRLSRDVWAAVLALARGISREPEAALRFEFKFGDLTMTKTHVLCAMPDAAPQSGDARPDQLNLANLGGMNECDHEVLKEPIHAQQNLPRAHESFRSPVTPITDADSSSRDICN